MYLYKTTKQYVQLAQAEIEALCGKTTILDEHLFLCKDYDEKTAKRLAYTKSIYQILSQSKEVDEVLHTPIKDNYRFDAVGEDTLLLANKLHDLHKKQVKLEEYEHHYVLFVFDGVYYFCEEIYVNVDTGEGRKAHQREHNHPTSMHPLLAKAMVNLCGKDSFIDPFCGAGGILIEGAKMGLLVFGTDISEDMIERAEANLDSMGLVAQLAVQNALVIESEYDAIVTDLPYGKNSMKKGEDLYDAFLENAKHITDTMVIGCQEGQLTDLHGWKVKNRFSIYTHKSLTREILVLEK